jgi:hypothetical protein
MGTIYRNNKTGLLYKYLADATDCSNTKDHHPETTRMVIYCQVTEQVNETYLNDLSKLYVREQQEFKKKFSEVKQHAA